MINKEKIEEIRGSVEIEKVIGETIALKTAGRQLVGLCPFHEDHSPSFTVYPDTQSWHCFGCGKGGDVFKFFQDSNGGDFPKALKEVARIGGVSLQDNEESSDYAEHRKLEEIRLSAVSYYHQILFGEEGKAALDYLVAKRGLSFDLIKDFQLGYAPAGKSSLSNYLAEKGFSVESGVKAGVLTSSNTGYFKGYLVFPNIINGRVVTFQGRTFPDHEPKYKLESGTIDHLIGEPALNRHNDVLVVEGWPDFLTLRQAGYENVVGIFGVSGFKENWVQKFARVKTVYLALDGDKPGEEGASKIAALFTNSEVRIVHFPKVDSEGGASVKDWNELFVETHQKSIETFKDNVNGCLNSAEIKISTGIIVPEVKKRFPKSQADYLLDLLKERVGTDTFYFLDEIKGCWAAMKVDEHWEYYPTASRKYKQFARKIFYQAYEKGMNSEALTTALSNLEAILPELEEHTLNLRVAREGDDLYYDLCDRTWNVVKITTQGWEIVNNHPVFFKRFQHQKNQVIPVKNGGDINGLLQFVNTQDENARILLLVTMVAAFVPNIPHPIVVLHGSQGSSKSFLFKILRDIIEPSALQLLSLSKDKAELVQLLAHHYFAPFDNLTELSDWVSDVMSRAVTGSGDSKRKLYSDDDDIIYSFHRCIGLNGINCVVLKPDLLDRSILIRLDRISKEKRREEQALWKEFLKAKPSILGGIFDTLSRALTIYPGVALTQLPRMADFTRWGYAIAEALEIGGERFLQAYDSSIKDQNEQVIESTPVANCLVHLMENRLEWTGTATDLFEAITEEAEALKINTKQGWPKAPNALIRKLNIVKTTLEETGIDYTRNSSDKKIHLTRKIGENTADIEGIV